MAQKVSVILTDDLDPDVPATTTVSFGLDGTNYEIDLSDENAAKMRDALAVYVGAARRAKGSSLTRSKTAVQPRTGPSPKEIREWAKKQGMDVPERGRFPKEIIDAYDKAHSK